MKWGRVNVQTLEIVGVIVVLAIFLASLLIQRQISITTGSLPKIGNTNIPESLIDAISKAIHSP
jgi:hypothetical protein